MSKLPKRDVDPVGYLAVLYGLPIKFVSKVLHSWQNNGDVDKAERVCKAASNPYYTPQIRVKA